MLWPVLICTCMVCFSCCVRLNIGKRRPVPTVPASSSAGMTMGCTRKSFELDFHLPPFGHVSRVVLVCLFRDFIFRNLTLRLLPFFNFSNVLTPYLLVEFVDSLDELWRQIGRCLVVGFRLRLGFSFRLRLGFGFRLRLRLGVGFRLVGLGLNFGLRLRFSFGFGFGFRLRLSVRFRLVGLGLNFGFRPRLSFGFGFRLGLCVRLLNLPLRLLPVLN